MKTKTTLLGGGIVLAALIEGFGQPSTGSTFTRITTDPIGTDAAHSFGCSWGDYDNDGDLDLVVGNGLGDANALYRNDGNGSFTRVTNTITTTRGDSNSPQWGDYDNDGDLDLFVTNWQLASFLFRNDGHGNFVQVTTGGIFAGPADSNGCAWGDYDNDGFLDLVVANSNGQNEHLYRNNGNGTFTQILTGPVPNSNASSGTAAWGDYDNDGRLDLAISHAGTLLNSIMLLFHNEGGGNFSRVTDSPVAGNAESGADWGDYDNDGDLDLCGAAWSGGSADGAVLVYRNDGAGVFTRLSLGVFAVIPLGGIWGDYDNDGWLDLFVPTHTIPGQPSVGAVDLLFRNNGDGTFTRVTEGVVPNTIGIGGGGAAWADYDNNGFLDLFVANGHEVAQEVNFLYRNEGNNNHWLTIKCIGRASNRSGIGAKVRVQATIAGRERWQLREVSAGNGGNGSSLRTHFGLGNATNADLVRIQWPCGTVQELRNVEVNRILTVTEPLALTAGIMSGGAFQLSLKASRGIPHTIEYSTNLVHWRALTNFSTTQPVTLISDPGAAGLTRFYRAWEGD